MNTRSFLYANRKELSISLQVKEGKLPEDIYGVVYITSMCGSLNSGGYPIPERHPGDRHLNPEYGSPLLSGDGMIFKIDFNTHGQVNLQTSINKPPCYYADLATCRQNSVKLEKKFQSYGFKSMGLSRASAQLGFRNALNVAVTPFRFKTDPHPRMLVTFDAGRPWEFNTESLQLITPVGKNNEWKKSTPEGLKFPFSGILNTAHPAFDALTQELYTVNYTQSRSSGYKIAFLILMLEHRDEAENFLKEKSHLLEKIWEGVEDASNFLREAIHELKQFFEAPHRLERFKTMMNSVLHKYQLTMHELEHRLAHMDLKDEVYLLRWNGKQEPLKKWSVVDEQGKDIKIDECMHQTALTEDYIILSDSSFKFAADIIISNPFPEVPQIDRMLRRLLNKNTPVDTAIYLVRRADLQEQAKIVVAKKIVLPEDCVHFVANYKNSSDIIKLYAFNSNSVCVSEWIRPYDKLNYNGKPVYPELIGTPATAGVDLNSISKYEISFEKGIVNRQDYRYTGGRGPGAIDGPHTWSVSLFTYRDMISSDKIVEEVKNIFIFSAGLTTQRLTEFIFSLFKDIPDKIISTEELLKYTEAGVPQVLFRLETGSMEVKDFFLCDFNTEFRSIQFVPARQEREGDDYSMNGYILCVMMVGEDKRANAPSTMQYERELWLFEAKDLAKGPVCKFTHPELSYTLTLHSAWVAEAIPFSTEYHVSVREDYGNPESFFPSVEKDCPEFFEKYIYPHFE